jgi:hypothetical protein
LPTRYDGRDGLVNDELDGDELSARDARLLHALGRALGPDPLPDRLVERAAQLLALRDLDATLLMLTESATAEPAGMRGDTTRSPLEFATGDGSAAVELAPGLDRLVGQVLAGDAIEVALESRSGARATAAVDELGRFTFERVAAGPARLRLLGGATTPVTDWFLL